MPILVSKILIQQKKDVMQAKKYQELIVILDSFGLPIMRANMQNVLARK